MSTSRKDYMRVYMRKYRAQKQGMVPNRINHSACDKALADKQQEIDALTAEIEMLRKMLPF